MSNDRLQRFIFADSDVRGEIITLEESYQRILANGSYPETINCLLGEMTAAAGLLSATMKFDGVLTLHARGDGDLSMIMAECTRQHMLRAIATLKPEANPTACDLGKLLGHGHLAITIDPARGERYQGIVPLEYAKLSTCIEEYFDKSEQLPTRLWLFCDGVKAGGLLIQALPLHAQSQDERDDYWQHLCVLADTLTTTEFLAESPESILTRLFHQEEARLFPAESLEFGCTCSDSRTSDMLRTLGESAVREILQEEGEVAIQCQFCHQQYRFDKPRIDEIFSSRIKTLH